MSLERPLPIAQIRKFKPELVAEVDRSPRSALRPRDRRDPQPATAGSTWESKPFNLKKIAFIRTAYKLPSRYQRLRRRGMLTTREVAAKFGVARDHRPRVGPPRAHQEVLRRQSQTWTVGDPVWNQNHQRPRRSRRPPRRYRHITRMRCSMKQSSCRAASSRGRAAQCSRSGRRDPGTSG